MKDLNKFINESLKDIILYHVSREQINKIEDSPLFLFDNTKESNALYKNTKYESSAYQYKLIFDKSINILNYKDSKEYFDEDTEADLCSNPTTEELKSICDKIESKSKADGITIMDYSQVDYNEDTESIIIFHPNKFIKNIKKIK